MADGDRPEGFFLPMTPAARGVRLALYRRPADGVARGSVVYVHPFAEEMNKSRRMAALQARAFARAGYAVLQIDLLGCGDSSGDFGDATWEDWVEDVVKACRWVVQRNPAPLTLWGLRAGCLLAAAAASRLAAPPGLLLWQPAVTGKAVLQQFLRLKLAAGIQAGGGPASVDQLRARLAAGEAIDVAGYRLGAALADGLERATLEPTPRVDGVAWLEVSAREPAALLPASSMAIERWRGAGHRVEAAVVNGPAFWQSVEVEEAPALIDATLASIGAVATA